MVMSSTSRVDGHDPGQLSLRRGLLVGWVEFGTSVELMLYTEQPNLVNVYYVVVNNASGTGVRAGSCVRDSHAGFVAVTRP